MNKKTLILLAFLVFTTNFYGQRRPDREKIKSLKIAFITERLSLTSEEAQYFWPLYNEYQNKREALKKRERTAIKDKIKNADNLTEKDAQNILKQYISIEDEEEVLDKTFLNDVSKVISAKKTLFLLRAEEEFKRKLIKQYRQKRTGGGGFR